MGQEDDCNKDWLKGPIDYCEDGCAEGYLDGCELGSVGWTADCWAKRMDATRTGS